MPLDTKFINQKIQERDHPALAGLIDVNFIKKGNVHALADFEQALELTFEDLPALWQILEFLAAESYNRYAGFVVFVASRVINGQWKSESPTLTSEQEVARKTHNSRALDFMYQQTQKIPDIKSRIEKIEWLFSVFSGRREYWIGDEKSVAVSEYAEQLLNLLIDYGSTREKSEDRVLALCTAYSLSWDNYEKTKVLGLMLEAIPQLETPERRRECAWLALEWGESLGLSGNTRTYNYCGSMRDQDERLRGGLKKMEDLLGVPSDRELTEDSLNGP